MRISAIIVLYNPIQSVLQKLIESVIYQVTDIILVDNSTNIEIKKTIQIWYKKQDSPNFHYIDLYDNVGIAKAQNEGINFAIEMQAKFLLLLDQDSLLPKNMVSTLIDSYNKLSLQYANIACVAPAFMDIKTNQIAPVIHYDNNHRHRIIPSHNENFIKVSHVISSGSLIPIKAWHAIGGFREELFIDYVDTEWCLRAEMQGYQSFIIPTIIMHHDLGDRYLKIGKKQVVIHSDFRNYFLIRNSAYLIQHTNLSKSFKLFELKSLIFKMGVFTIASENKFKTLRIMLIGLKDGIIKNMGKGYFQNKGV